MEETKNTNVSEENQNTEETTTETTTYSAEEVSKLIQAEADKRVNQALEKQKRHYEKQLSLSTLDDEARNKAEKDMRIQELEEKLKEFNVLQTKSEVIKVLNNRGLNPQFADLIAIGEDVEEAQKRIETLDKLFKNAVQEEVKKRLNSTVPAIGADATGTINKETLKKMNAAQRTALYHSDPELYKSLISK